MNSKEKKHFKRDLFSRNTVEVWMALNHRINDMSVSGDPLTKLGRDLYEALTECMTITAKGLIEDEG